MYLSTCTFQIVLKYRQVHIFNVLDPYLDSGCAESIYYIEKSLSEGYLEVILRSRTSHTSYCCRLHCIHFHINHYFLSKFNIQSAVCSILVVYLMYSLSCTGVNIPLHHGDIELYVFNTILSVLGRYNKSTIL